MTSTLERELHQTKPFRNLETEAVLSIVRTAGLLGQQIADALRPHGLTTTQYNVLRILRGMGEEGLCRYEVGERLLTPVPDVTRLLDRLEEAGFVGRSRDPEDRRQSRARISPRGLALLERLDDTLDELHRRQVGHLGEPRLRQLIELLATARANRVEPAAACSPPDHADPADAPG